MPADSCRIGIVSFCRGMPRTTTPKPLENQNEYRKWLGRLTDPMATPEDRREAMNQEFAFMNLPANQRQQLNMLKLGDVEIG